MRTHTTLVNLKTKRGYIHLHGFIWRRYYLDEPFPTWEEYVEAGWETSLLWPSNIPLGEFRYVENAEKALAEKLGKTTPVSEIA